MRRAEGISSLFFSERGKQEKEEPLLIFVVFLYCLMSSMSKAHSRVTEIPPENFVWTDQVKFDFISCL